MGGKGANASQSSSQSFQEGRSFVDPAQAQFLEQLRSQGQGLAQQQLPQIQEQSLALQNQLSGQGNQFGGALQQQAQGQDPFTSGLAQLGNQQNPFLQQQIAGLGGDLQRFLSTSLNKVGSGFAGANQFGSGRQGLAEGQAITGAINEFGQQSANLRGGDLQRQAQALQAGGQLQQGAAAQGIAGLQGRFNLGLGSFGAAFQPLLAQQQLVGGPTVLQESQGRSSSDSSSFGVSGF